MGTEIRLPKLSDNMEEGTLVRWLKRVGEPVEKGEPLAEVETDKASVELEAETAGVLSEIRVEEGAVAPVGAVIAVLGAPGEAVAAPTAPKQMAPAAPAKENRQAPVERAAAPVKPAPVAPTPPRAATAAPTTAVAPTPSNRTGHIRASPLAWKLAEDLGVNLDEVRGSGPGGRIVKADVEAAARARSTAVSSAAAPMTKVATTAEAAPAVAGTKIVPHSKMRQTIARRMSEAKRDIPHFYVTVEIGMDEAMRMRATLKEAGRIPNLTVTHVVVRALTLVLTKFPRVNASWRDEGVEPHDAVNMGIAVAVDDGLLVPVLHDCQALSLKQVADGISALSERARTGKFAANDLTGGTFSLSNLGMLDVEEFSAIINPPQVALLATGSVKERPVVRNGELAIARTMRATLSCDHRVLDGVEAGRFLEALKDLLEKPVLLLGE